MKNYSPSLKQMESVERLLAKMDLSCDNYALGETTLFPFVAMWCCFFNCNKRNGFI